MSKKKKTASINPDAGLNTPTPHVFLIVGLGASAGGIQAFQEFFQQVPERSGMAYVVILHLSPDHDSRLAQVLQSSTKIPVFKVTQKQRWRQTMFM